MSNMDRLNELAGNLGFRVDPHSGMMYGQRGAYPLAVEYNNNTYTISASVSQAGMAPTADAIKQGIKECKPIHRCVVKGYHVFFLLRGAATKKRFQEMLEEALQWIPVYFSRNGYSPCCEQCGQITETSGYNVKGRAALLCPSCFSNVSNSLAEAQLEEETKGENIVAGLVGALLGSLVGGLAIVLIGQLGFISGISGVVMGVCTLYGYRMLGGKLTVKGIVISALVMVGMVYLSNRIVYAIEIMKAVNEEYGSYGISFSFFDAFKTLPDFVKELPELKSVYYSDLFKTYAFTALGAVPTVIQKMKERSNAHLAERL
ncbi:MAG: hypothetical protein IK016_11300 [Lachnospiraceae bacterium]|nr:hypothetical protein [Lachnospiraceae bacterium]